MGEALKIGDKVEIFSRGYDDYGLKGSRIKKNGGPYAKAVIIYFTKSYKKVEG